MPRAVVQVFRKNEEGKRVLAQEASLDEVGGLVNPGLGAAPDQCRFVVRHADYGIAMARRAPYEGFDRSAYCYVPQVHRESKEYGQSIRGVILDPDGDPLSGARISCRGIRAPGGVWAYGLAGDCTVMSEQDGRFAMYLPIQSGLGAYEVPAHSTYKVMIEPPGDSGLALWSGGISNDRECTVVLERGNHFRTFVFRDSNGAVTDPEKLKAISLRVEVPDYGTWSVGYPEFEQGCVLPLGQVKAAMYSVKGWPFGLCEFEPVLITDDSPQELVFTAKPKPADKEIMYRGLVVHGITGQPMAGAFVAAADTGGVDFSVLGAERWRKLHELPNKPSVTDPHLQQFPVALRGIARTDERGRFEVRVSRITRFYYIIAFEKDFLAMHYDIEGKWEPKTKQENVVEIAALKLYPAATVYVEPWVEPGPSVRISARWELLNNESVAWFEEFAAEYGPAARYMENLYLGPNKMGSIHIPAGLNLRIRFGVVRSLTWDDRQWLPVVTESIRAGQGEIVNLGRLTFEQPMWIYVQLVDSAGEPVKGVAVRHERDKHGPPYQYDQVCVTDEEGIGQFHVPAYSEGAFAVVSHDPNKGNVRESVSYQTNGPEDANSLYTLQVSDKILEAIFK